MSRLALVSSSLFARCVATLLLGAPCLAPLSLLLAADAHAQRLRITIDDPNFRPYPIAISELTDLSSPPGAGELLGADLTKTLRADLEFSPVFAVLDPKSFLASQGESWTAPKYADWLNVGASGLVRGGLHAIGNEVKVIYRFYDVAGQREAFSKAYSEPKSSARMIAHRFADDLVKFFTGEDGVFSTQIAFTVRAAEGTQLQVIDFDGQNGRAVVNNRSINLLPSWDRGGERLFFTSYLNNNPDLFAMELGTGKLSPLSAQRGINTGAAISPDGGKVALTLSKDGNSEIYVMNRDGTDLKRLTENWWIDTSPTWSPDGKQLAFVSSKTGNPHIYVMNADGSGARRVTFQGTYNQTPDWSPRGNVIAFTARDERFQFDIFTVDPANSEIKRLTQDQGNNEEPSFAPDGRMLAFVSNRTGRKSIWVMSADGNKQKLVFQAKADAETPAWSPRRKR